MSGARRAEPGFHGQTTNGYTNYGCRCVECTGAHSAYVETRKQQRRALLQRDPGLVQHGLYSTYTNWMCRCAECREAARLRDVKQRSGQ